VLWLYPATLLRPVAVENAEDAELPGLHFIYFKAVF
jgi:hypothetical protein